MASLEWREDRLNWDALPQAPMELFADWHTVAAKTEPWEAGAMLLATANAGGAPSARIVLMRGYGPEGIRFFTNYDSPKGKVLADNPRFAVVFWWPSQVRQVRLEGNAARLPRAESEAYFEERPRGSQLGAWSSPQSQPIRDLSLLASQYDEVERSFAGQDVPCPPFWGGYLLQPDRVEFWQGGKDRLHDRALYTRNNQTWQLERLAP